MILILTCRCMERKKLSLAFYIAIVKFAQSCPYRLTDAISGVGNRLKGKIRAFLTSFKIFNNLLYFCAIFSQSNRFVISLSATSPEVMAE